VEVISRDRAGAYAEAAQRGAPQAVQVADRFHLICNLSSAVERVIEQNMPQIRDAICGEGDHPEQPNAPEAIIRTAAETRKQERRERRLNRYKEVVAMHQGGMSQAEICRATGMEKKTVRRFLRAGAFPERACLAPRPSQLDSFQPYLRQRWSEGCHNATQLWREIKNQGFAGARGMVARFISKLRVKASKHFRASGPHRKPVKPISPKAIAMLFTKAPETLAATDQAGLSRLLQQCPDLSELQQIGRGFREALRLHSVEAFTGWREQASRSTFGPIHRFATALRRDEHAISAAVSLPWSNGQVEGQVHRLKLIKRQMYGRGSFQLLRRRILPYQHEPCFANGYRAP
jgi:transposase